MEFCSNCGSPLNGEKFCQNCGTAAEDYAEQQVSEQVSEQAPEQVADQEFVPEAPANKNYAPFILGGAAILAVVIIAIIFSAIFGGYKPVVKSYMKAALKGDGKKIVSLMPKKLVKAAADELCDGDMDELIDKVEDVMDSVVEYMENNDVDPKKIKFEIKDVEKVTKKELKDLNEELEDEDIKVKIKDAKKVEVKIKGTDEDGKTQKQTRTVTVVKVGLKWYVLPF